MSNTTNQFYVPEKEMNFDVYETNFKEPYTPNQEIATIEDTGLVVFKYEAPTADKDGFIKLPQVPYEIKEHALKGFLYTFFTTAIGRLFSNFAGYSFSYLYIYVPCGIFFYQYGNSLWYMYNAVTEIKLLPDGKNIKLGFKFRPSMTVSISQLIKKKEENFLNECYTEPILYPIQINRTEQYGKYSLRSHLTVYLYAESHKSILNGEILRAIINNHPITLPARE